MSWQYVKLGQAGPVDHFICIDEEAMIAEVRDANDPEWERQDAYFAEVTYNGQGSPCSEAEALAVVPA